MTIAEKVAYLKGMFDGMELDAEKSKEAKLISAVLDVLEDIAGALDEYDDKFEAVEEEIDALSDDLADVEEFVYDEVLEEGTIQCPNCEQKFVLDLSDEECDCDCGCCHDHEDEDDED